MIETEPTPRPTPRPAPPSATPAKPQRFGAAVALLVLAAVVVYGAWRYWASHAGAESSEDIAARLSQDVAALQALPVANNYTACMDAISDAGIGRKLGFRDAFQQSEDKWFAAVDAALAKNVVTFAVLDIGQMVGPDGYLAKLKAKGYTVLAPDE